MLSPPSVSLDGGDGDGLEPVDPLVPVFDVGGGEETLAPELSVGAAVGAAMTRSPKTSNLSRSGSVSVGNGVGDGVGGAENSIFLVTTSSPSGPFENEIELVWKS